MANLFSDGKCSSSTLIASKSDPLPSFPLPYICAYMRLDCPFLLSRLFMIWKQTACVLSFFLFVVIPSGAITTLPVSAVAAGFVSPFFPAWCRVFPCVCCWCRCVFLLSLAVCHTTGHNGHLKREKSQTWPSNAFFFTINSHIFNFLGFSWKNPCPHL